MIRLVPVVFVVALCPHDRLFIGKVLGKARVQLPKKVNHGGLALAELVDEFNLVTVLGIHLRDPYFESRACVQVRHNQHNSVQRVQI